MFEQAAGERPDYPVSEVVCVGFFWAKILTRHRRLWEEAPARSQGSRGLKLRAGRPSTGTRRQAQGGAAGHKAAGPVARGRGPGR